MPSLTNDLAADNTVDFGVVDKFDGFGHVTFRFMDPESVEEVAFKE